MSEIAAGGRICILISGRGSNMEALVSACESGKLPATVCGVVSNNPGAAGLELAGRRGLHVHALDHRAFAERESFDAALADYLDSLHPDLILLAGFMRILSASFIERFRGRILNIHPSLLPKYPGLNTHQRALDAGDREAGATVHFVTAELDGGPPVIHAAVPVRPGDTSDTLAERILEREHRIYPVAAKWFLEGRLQLTHEGAFLDGEKLPPGGRRWEE